MQYISQFFMALYELSNAMSPYIIFGLLFAGIMHELVPDSLVRKHLGNSSVGAVIKATLFGIPLPVCSCGVIPLATAMKKSGASSGATLSFLISTPITGIDSILATYGMFGWAFTLYRLITSMLMAMIAGVLTNIFDTPATQTASPATPAFSTAPNVLFSATAPLTTSAQESSACCSSSGCGCDDTSTTKRFSLRAALHYGFITLLGDIAKPLFYGLLIGALITTAMSENLQTLIGNNYWLSYLIVIAIAVPMYVCATASLPIAAALILSGVSAGAAFIFLSAGPATNTVTIGVVKKMLGTRALTIYLTSITLGSLLFGMGLDWLFVTIDINPASLVTLSEEATVLSMVSSLLLWAFVLYFMLAPLFKPKKSCCSSEGCCT